MDLTNDKIELFYKIAEEKEILNVFERFEDSFDNKFSALKARDRIMDYKKQQYLKSVNTADEFLKGYMEEDINLLNQMENRETMKKEDIKKLAKEKIKLLEENIVKINKEIQEIWNKKHDFDKNNLKLVEHISILTGEITKKNQELESQKSELQFVVDDYNTKLNDLKENEKRVNEIHMKTITENLKLTMEKGRVMQLYKIYLEYSSQLDKYVYVYSDLLNYYRSLNKTFSLVSKQIKQKIEKDFEPLSNEAALDVMMRFFKKHGLPILPDKDKDNFYIIVNYLTDEKTAKKLQQEPFNFFDYYTLGKLIKYANEETPRKQEIKQIENKIEEKISKIQKEIKEKIKECTNLNEGPNDSEIEELETLKKELNNLKKSTSEDMIQELDEEIEILKTKMDKLQKMKIPSKEQQEKFKKQENKLEAEINSIEDKESLSSPEMKKQVQIIENELEKHAAKYEEKIQEEKEKAKKEINDIKDQIKQKKQEKKDCETKFEDEKNLKIEKKTKEIKEKKKEIDEIKRGLSTKVQGKIEILENEIDNKKKEIKVLEEKIDDFKFLIDIIKDFFGRFSLNFKSFMLEGAVRISSEAFKEDILPKVQHFFMGIEKAKSKPIKSKKSSGLKEINYL